MPAQPNLPAVAHDTQTVEPLSAPQPECAPARDARYPTDPQAAERLKDKLKELLSTRPGMREAVEAWVRVDLTIEPFVEIRARVLPHLDAVGRDAPEIAALTRQAFRDGKNFRARRALLDDMGEWLAEDETLLPLALAIRKYRSVYTTQPAAWLQERMDRVEALAAHGRAARLLREAQRVQAAEAERIALLTLPELLDALAGKLKCMAAAVLVLEPGTPHVVTKFSGPRKLVRFAVGRCQDYRKWLREAEAQEPNGDPLLITEVRDRFYLRGELGLLLREFERRGAVSVLVGVHGNGLEAAAGKGMGSALGYWLCDQAAAKWERRAKQGKTRRAEGGDA